MKYTAQMDDNVTMDKALSFSVILCDKPTATVRENSKMLEDVVLIWS